MSSADFLLVRPLKLDGTVPFSRASDATFYDAAGVLQTAPPNTLRMTYDPADLSKAPYALIEPEETNHIRNNTMQGAVAGLPGTLPDFWRVSIAAAVAGVVCTVAGSGSESGIRYVDLRFQGTVSARGNISIFCDGFDYWVAASAGETWAASAYLRLVGGSNDGIEVNYLVIEEYVGNTYLAGEGYFRPAPSAAALRDQLVERSRVLSSPSAAKVGSYIGMTLRQGATVDFTLRIGLPQLARNKVPKYPIHTLNGAVTRAADVIGPGAGLVYSSVPITEPLWAAGTYAKGAKVRDAQNFVYESLADGNTATTTDKTKWLPLGVTNRLKMFDKAVNSQTVAPDSLTVVVKAGQLANTLTLLNAAGSSVTVTQSESGHSRTIPLVSHDVLSWYDFYYQEPQWTGDVTFGNIPPYINSLLTVHVKSPGNQAALGGFFLGRAKFIGKTQWGLKAGILSYSGEEEDEFGNVTLLPRESAKKMNFDVAIPRGYEDEVYRFMRAADNVEMVAIASTNWSMTQSYGYLGQWEVPLGIEGEKMPVEWRGLI